MKPLTHDIREWIAIKPERLNQSPKRNLLNVILINEMVWFWFFIHNPVAWMLNKKTVAVYHHRIRINELHGSRSLFQSTNKQRKTEVLWFYATYAFLPLITARYTFNTYQLHTVLTTLSSNGIESLILMNNM